MNHPIIAVTPDYKHNKYSVLSEYADAIIVAGGLPIILPYTTDAVLINGMLDQVDGLLLTGGSDVDPALYGEEPEQLLGKIIPERDAFEAALIQNALKQNMPILAICRGNLILNAAAGGSLYQDIYSQDGATLQHKQDAPRDHASHAIHLKEKTLLQKIVGSDVIRVNSFHHQAVKKAAPGFQISAVASDGTIEAIEFPELDFVLGVQWHPGSLIKKDPHSQDIFRAFIKAANKRNSKSEK